MDQRSVSGHRAQLCLASAGTRTASSNAHRLSRYQSRLSCKYPAFPVCFCSTYLIKNPQKYLKPV